MMKKFLMVSALASAVVSLNAFSSPPSDEKYHTFRQADGSEVILMRYGDARFHWLETRTGEVVVKNPATGDYEYAVIAKEKGNRGLAPSGVRVETSKAGQTQAGETIKTDFIPLTRKDVIPLRKAALIHKKIKPKDTDR